MLHPSSSNQLIDPSRYTQRGSTKWKKGRTNTKQSLTVKLFGRLPLVMLICIYLYFFVINLHLRPFLNLRYMCYWTKMTYKLCWTPLTHWNFRGRIQTLPCPESLDVKSDSVLVLYWVSRYGLLYSNGAAFYMIVIVCPLPTYYNLCLSEVNHSFRSKLCETLRQQEHERALYLCLYVHQQVHTCFCLITGQGNWNLYNAPSTV